MSKRICILLACLIGGAVSLSGQSGTMPTPPATKLENITFSTPLPHAPWITLATNDDLLDFKLKTYDNLNQLAVKMLEMDVEISILKKQVKKLEAERKTGKE